MNKFIHTLFVVCLTAFVHAQVAPTPTFELTGTDTINKVDGTGKKQGKWIW